MLNVHQLHVFLVAAETLNFTQAAQRLQMTQPSVSQHIQALEQQFGTDLFNRSGRSLELTEAGKTLMPLTRELVNQSTRIEETMDSLKGDIHGHILVGCSTTVGCYLLPRLLAYFHNKYPQVRATCHVSSAVNVIRMLCDGIVHLVLTSSPKPCKNAEYQKFSTEQILLVVAPSHPWAKFGQITPRDLHKEVFILPEEGSETHIAVQEALDGVQISIFQLESLMISGSPEAIALSVQEGLGAGFVLKVVVDNIVRGKVVPVEIQGLKITQDVYIGRSTNRPHTTAQDAFWEFIFSKENDILDRFEVEPPIQP